MENQQEVEEKANTAQFKKLKLLGCEKIFCGMSFGKDSLVTWDLMLKSGIQCIPFFMYFVKDLSFIVEKIKFFEKIYRIKVIQVPHFGLSYAYSAGFMRRDSEETLKCTQLKLIDIENYMRSEHGDYNSYFAYGQKIADSLERLTYLRQCQKDNFIDYSSSNSVLYYKCSLWFIYYFIFN